MIATASRKDTPEQPEGHRAGSKSGAVKVIDEGGRPLQTLVQIAAQRLALLRSIELPERLSFDLTDSLP